MPGRWSFIDIIDIPDITDIPDMISLWSVIIDLYDIPKYLMTSNTSYKEGSENKWKSSEESNPPTMGSHCMIWG